MGKIVRCRECGRVYRELDELEDLRDNDSVCLQCNNTIEVADWDRVLASYEEEDGDVDDDEDDWDDDEDEVDEEEAEVADEEFGGDLEEEEEEEDEDEDDDEEEDEDEDEDEDDEED